jgi:hypothetical protein
MASFEEFVAALQEGTKALAKENFDGFEDEAKEDADKFLEKSENDLRRWTKLLSQGDINEEDFSDLVSARKALAEMFALRQAGLALIKLEKFRKGFIDLLINTAFDVFL